MSPTAPVRAKPEELSQPVTHRVVIVVDPVTRRPIHGDARDKWHSPPTGTPRRLASQEDCDFAMQLVQRYVEDLRHHVEMAEYRGDEVGACSIPIGMADDLAGHLTHFAAHGTFVHTARSVARIRDSSIRAHFDTARKRGMAPEGFMEWAVEYYGCSEQTIRNAIWPRKAKRKV